MAPESGGQSLGAMESRAQEGALPLLAAQSGVVS